MKIPGTTREEEEQNLAEIIEIAQNHLDHVKEEIANLTEDTENFMFEANKTKDKAILTLWNNTRAQLNAAKGWLVRAEKARKKPYFGRIDFQDIADHKEESYYVGRVGIAKSGTEPIVIDWRAPVASLYYENGIGRGNYVVDGKDKKESFEIDLQRKRTYEIDKDRLIDFYDMDVVSNDELLTKYLSKNKTEVLSEIIATIQQEQNRIIRRSPKTNVIVQGVAGSGKTTVAMHRISYILFNYENDFRPEDFYIIGSNEILLNYITGVLPELDVTGVRQMTMEALFIRLLYEDWNPNQYRIRKADKADKDIWIKGSVRWFLELQDYCREYELTQIPCDDIYMEKYGRVLLSGTRIRAYIKEHPELSMQSKRLMLNDILYAQYENLCSGRYSRFTEDEKKKLDKKYHTYFAKWGKYGKSVWEGSIYQLYQDFLESQRIKGYRVRTVEDAFDLYDLASLAYLYKRIKETDPIREASHVVIDEAQDFGMMAYQSLHYCLRGCTYTIMGDTSQNIHYQYGLNDWNELKNLILNGPNDKFELLRKSYRNTIEISQFATDILHHGDFAVYPVEPIIRHGNPVEVARCEDLDDLTARAVTAISFWQMKGYETIAVVCQDEKEAIEVREELQGRVDIKDMEEDAVFGSGVMVLPVADTKGLEFDAVLIWNPSEDHYPADNGRVKLLYVAATRALHELSVFYTNHLTTLISEKASKENRLEEVDKDDKTAKKEETIDKKSTVNGMDQHETEENGKRSERGYLGPAKIQVNPVQNKLEREGMDVVRRPQAVREKEDTKKDTIGNKTEKQAGRNIPVNESAFKYGEIPKDTALAVKGHVKANTAVKWVKKSKIALEVTSTYGTLVLSPVSEECIRIRFTKGMIPPKGNTFWNPKEKSGLKWTARESSTTIEVATAKVTVRIDKKDGAVKFMTPERKLLLSERSSDCRFIDGSECWNFFEFDRSEKLKSKGTVKDDFTDLTNKARYISFGGRGLRMPLVLSNKGYALAIAGEKTTLFCGIKTYGPYIYTDGTNQIDYFFLYGKSHEKNQELYGELFR